MELIWQHPFTAIVAGPSGCGKTEFTLKFIDHLHEIMKPDVEKIMWCYSLYQEVFDRYSQVTFHEGLPDLSMFDGKQRTLLILDDLMSESEGDDRVSQIFTKFSHHRNVSVFYLTQNLFYKGKRTRTISLNAHYIVMFKNVRDTTQIANLAKQMYPGNGRFMLEAFKDATMIPYGYLVVDLNPQTDEGLRLKTNIFPVEIHYVYLKK